MMTSQPVKMEGQASHTKVVEFQVNAVERAKACLTQGRREARPPSGVALPQAECYLPGSLPHLKCYPWGQMPT